MGGTSNQGVLNHRRDHQNHRTNHNRDWVKALNEPLIMSTAQLRTTGGDHLVEMGFETRGLVGTLCTLPLIKAAKVIENLN